MGSEFFPKHCVSLRREAGSQLQEIRDGPSGGRGVSRVCFCWRLTVSALPAKHRANVDITVFCERWRSVVALAVVVAVAVVAVAWLWWATGSPGHRASEVHRFTGLPPGHWFTGPLGHRGSPVHRVTTGPPGHRATGPPRFPGSSDYHRATGHRGSPAHRATGSPGHRLTGPPGHQP